MMATGCRLGLRVLVCIDIASFARYAGLYGGVLRLPTARGLAVGYTLSPATRACTEACFAYPRLADSPWATRCRPLTRACTEACFAYPRLADSPWATRCRPLRGLVRRRASLTHGSRTRRGLHAVARYAGLYGGVLRLPTARGLAVGYTLSPADAGLYGGVLRLLELRRSSTASV